MERVRGAASLAPVQAAERILALDVLRGFALFGILLVNMAYFRAPIYLAVTNLEWFPGPVDQTAALLVQFFAENKFVTLFSFLFGVGMAIQMERAEGRGARFLPLYLRRTLVLLLIGLAHGLFLWMGDILTAYGALGFVLLLFRKASARALKIWTVLCLLLPVLILGSFVGMMELGRMVPGAAAEIDRQTTASDLYYAERAEATKVAYAAGPFATLAAMRVEEYRFIYSGMLYGGTLFYILGLFLVGLQVGRAGLLQAIGAHEARWRRLLWWGLFVGVPANLLHVWASGQANRAALEPMTVLYTVAFVVGAPALCAAYVAGITLLLQHKAWAPRLSLLAPVGRMALSNYLLQSLVATTLFYSYGGAMYGKVGPAASLPIALVLFALQIPLSHWWLSRYRFGPAEWLWRSLTYLKLQPIRL